MSRKSYFTTYDEYLTFKARQRVNDRRVVARYNADTLKFMDRWKNRTESDPNDSIPQGDKNED